MGSNIRPRISVPTSWNWYFGTCLSIECGIVKDSTTNNYDADYKIRPVFENKHEFEFGIGGWTTLSSDVWNIKLI